MLGRVAVSRDRQDLGVACRWQPVEAGLVELAAHRIADEQLTLGDRPVVCHQVQGRLRTHRRQELAIGLAANRELQAATGRRSEEHTSELQSLMRNSYAVFCFKKKKNTQQQDAT